MNIPLEQIFTEGELRQAAGIYQKMQPFHQEALKIVRPLMPRIDAATGQENDLNYMAYLLEHVVIQLLAQEAKSKPL